MNLQQAKNRVISVEETEKITKAMQLVATARLQRLRREQPTIDLFASEISRAFKALRDNFKITDLSFLGKRDEGAGKTLFIVIYSNFGLCGNYNLLVTRLLNSTCKEDDLIIALGNRATSQLRDREKQILKIVHDTNDLISRGAIKESKEEILKILEERKDIKEVRIISTYFINALNFLPANFLLLGEEIKTRKNLRNTATTQEERTSPQFMLEPNSPELFLKSSFSLYLEAMLAYSYSQAKLSEMSLRRNAMESASDSAEKLKKELELSYNRIRQSNITQEISEIVAANLDNKR